MIVSSLPPKFCTVAYTTTGARRHFQWLKYRTLAPPWGNPLGCDDALLDGLHCFARKSLLQTSRERRTQAREQSWFRKCKNLKPHRIVGLPIDDKSFFAAFGMVFESNGEVFLPGSQFPAARLADLGIAERGPLLQREEPGDIVILRF